MRSGLINLLTLPDYTFHFYYVIILLGSEQNKPSRKFFSSFTSASHAIFQVSGFLYHIGKQFLEQVMICRLFSWFLGAQFGKISLYTNMD